MLFISMLFFLSAVIISSLVKNYYSPDKVSKRLKSEIAAALSNLETEIKKVAVQNTDDKNAFLGFLGKNYKDAFNQKGIEILVYKNDSLKFWTSDVFAAPFVNKDSANFSLSIVRNGSGYYLVKQLRVKNELIIALQLIQYNYRFSNQYLPTGFYKSFSAPDNAGIELSPGKYNINSPSGEFLFSISYQQPFEMAIWLQYLVFTLYITSFLCFILAIFILYELLINEFGRKWLFFFFFIFDVIILRAIQLYFRFPADLYQLQLFNPAFFASSDLLPSLGDFLINTLIGVQLSYLAFKKASGNTQFASINIIFRHLFAALSVLFLITIYYFLTQTISDLVLNSSISFHFENILSLPSMSHVGLLIIATLLLGFFFIFEVTGKILSAFIKGARLFIYITIPAVLAYVLYTYFSGNFDIVNSILLLFLIIILYFISVNSPVTIKTSRIIVVVVLLSALATYIVNNSESIRENEKRKILATHLSDARDNLAEYYFSEASKNIKLDSTLSGILSLAKSENPANDVSSYIRKKYFSGYWNKYVVQITVCQPDKKLNIMPGNIITGCDDYFNGKISQFMKPVSVPGLYFLRQSIDAMYYLGKIEVKHYESGVEKNNSIFVEISSNDIWKGLGYPELLFDTKNASSDNLFGYSYAFYYKGELVKNVGKFSYDIDNIQILKHKGENEFFVSFGYSHFVLKVEKNTMVVISKEVPRLSDLISPFSYIFLLILIMLLLINLLTGSLLQWNIGIYTFRLRLQLRL